MLRRISVVAAVVLLPASAFGADLAGVKKLLEIGDYAAAVTELHGITKAEPENVEARLLMAKAFAECPFELQMPGAVTVGRSNQERAAYELGILVRLGAPGKERLLDAIENGEPKLALIAVQVAGREKLADAIPRIDRALKRKDIDSNFRNSAVSALAGIGGREAAAVIRPIAEAETGPGTSWIASHYIRCLDDEALLDLARTTKNPELLQQFALRDTAAVHEVLVRREDLSEITRTQSLGRLDNTLGKKDPAAFVRLLTDLLASKGSVRMAAITRLARLAPERAVEPLVALLADKEKANEALNMLHDLKDKVAVEPLMKVLEDKRDEKKHANWAVTRGSVFHALVRAGAEGETLLRAVRLMLSPDPAEPRATQAGDMRLPAVPRPQLAFVVGRLAEDDDPAVRRVAVQNLWMLDQKDAATVALKLLDDRDAQVRSGAEQTVLNAARSGLVPADKLELLLKSENTHVLRSAVMELTKVPDKAPLDPLLALLRDRTRAHHAIDPLARFFAAVPDEMATDALIDALHDEKSANSAIQIAEALKKCAPDVSVAARQVAKGLSHKSPAVRLGSAAALGVLGDRGVIQNLNDALREEKDYNVKRVIAETIHRLRADQ